MIEVLQLGLVLRITLDRPEKRNALDLALCRMLIAAFESAVSDESVGCVVLAANGPVFCAGMDLGEVFEVDPDEAAMLHERVFGLVHWFRKPVVAAVAGPALAGGVGLVANAQIVVAAPNTQFAVGEIRIGLWPVLIFRACALAMGERRATELSLTGRSFSAKDALGYGLVTELADDPLARAMEIAQGIAAFSPFAVTTGLDYVARIRGMGWEEAGAEGRAVRKRLMAAPDFARSVSAFLERRKA